MLQKWAAGPSLSLFYKANRPYYFKGQVNGGIKSIVPLLRLGE
jgi:hypothetical protein